MTMEKEVTGLYLTGHPMDAYREAARRRGGDHRLHSERLRPGGRSHRLPGRPDGEGGWRDLHI